MKEFIKTVSTHSLNKDEFFTMNALVGELGELANVIKKIQFHKDFESYNQRVEDEIQAGTRKPFREMLIDEAGDTLFYYIQLLNRLNLNIDDVIAYQTMKLSNQSEEYGRTFKK